MALICKKRKKPVNHLNHEVFVNGLVVNELLFSTGRLLKCTA